MNVTFSETRFTALYAHVFNRAYGVYILSGDLVPDWNHDRVIDESDREAIHHHQPFRFWIDDASENGDVATGNEAPQPSSSADCNKGQVCGRYDLENFFPVWLDISNLVSQIPPTDSDVQYILKQADSAVNMVYTELTTNSAGAYLTNDVPNCGANLDQYAYEATAVPITSGGLTLDTDFLNEITSDPSKGVLLLQGCAKTTKPLVLEVWKGATKVFQKDMPLSIDSVTSMFRFYNLRSQLGDTRNTLDQYPSNVQHEPSNNPDSACNNKNVIFIHGFKEDPLSALGNIIEVFKRLYWSGSRAKFTGVEWFSDQGTPPSLYYHGDVTNAFISAQYFANLLTYLSTNGENNVIAFSLGNMVVGSAIQDYGATPTRYFLLHAAMAKEAYDASEYDTGSNASDNNNACMEQAAWRTYDHRLYASQWFNLWNSQQTDGRYALTWQGRFANAVSVQTYNFYSSGDDVLDNINDGGPIVSDDWAEVYASGRYAWCAQELLKGRVPVGGGGTFSYGGWWFNPLYSAYTPGSQLMANLLNDQLSFLMQVPFFDNSAPVTSLVYDPNNPNAGSQFAATYRGKLLADMIPAISFATGRNNLGLLQDNNFNMQGNRIVGTHDGFQTGWPASRLNSNQTKNNWLHGDFRWVAYPFVYTLFDKISKDIGGFNQ